jgi:inosine-uridine nucleoside N-ribohydrolase
VRPVVRLWIDTDVGDDPDDAVALLCARGHPGVEIVGVSTVDGDHDRRVRAARALVDAPVYRGDDPGLAAAIAVAAPEALLAIGPLTNLGALLAAGATAPPVTLMGGLLGTVRHWGVELQVEHNFSRDPSAAERVLRQCAPLIVPLDVTVSMRLTEEQLGQLLALAPVLEPGVEAFLKLQRDFGLGNEERAVFLHDPLALLALVEPSLVRIEPLRLAVERGGRLVEAADGSSATVVRAVDSGHAIEDICGLIARSVG